jgi:uncharacterized protein YuzE
MMKPKMSYFSQEDILHLMISEEGEANSIELSPNITAELNAKGELIGLEIANASTFVRDAILGGRDVHGVDQAEPFGHAGAFGRNLTVQAW